MLIYTLPIIAALTGYITNFIAVKMLFHPRKPVRFLGLTIQGIFPKRQRKLAEKLGKIVADELFSFRDIKDRFSSTESMEAINTVLDEKLEDFLTNKLKSMMPMLSMFIKDETKEKIKVTLHEEFQRIFPEIIEKYTDKLERDIDIESIVYEKVVNFSSDKLEEILYSIMKKEFKFIELLGGVLGFIIGLIQLGLVLI